MIHNPHLEALIVKERYRAILAELTPKQLAVIALRLDDLPYNATALLLGLTRQGINQRMNAARRRLQDRFPELKTRVEQ